MIFTVWDVGGQEKLRPLWRHYFNNTDGLVMNSLGKYIAMFVASYYFCVQLLFVCVRVSYFVYDDILGNHTNWFMY